LIYGEKTRGQKSRETISLNQTCLKSPLVKVFRDFYDPLGIFKEIVSLRHD
jgi:hypothetical protein